jgi:hypothetical protein
MNVLYLSPHFPLHYSLFVERLAQHGVKVFGITDQPDECLLMPLREALSGHYRVDHLGNTEQVFAACEFFRNTFGPFDRVESHLEPWVELEAHIRDTYQVFGLKTAELGFMKKKSLMKKVFEKAQVPTARGIIVETPEQCLKFINKTYPVFIKPDIGVGASDTYTIRSEQDLHDFFAVKGPHPYFMEEFLDGIIESFDGLTDHEGNIVFYTSHVFNNDIHKIVAHNENLFYYSQREIPSDLTECGKKVVQAAGIKEKFFHIEFFRFPDGTLRGLEINMRPPGGLSTHMFNYACDIDVYDWWARIISGQSGNAFYERKYHCAFVGRKADRMYAFSHDELYRRFGERLVHFQAMTPIEYSVMGNHAYLVRSPHIEELLEILRQIHQVA